MRRAIYLSILLAFTVSCQGPSSSHIQAPSFGNQLSAHSLPLSFTNTYLKPCKFDLGTDIGHFPMFHYPASKETDPVKSKRAFEIVTRSQFQLLHTILFYKNNVAVFDETINSDTYNEHTLTELREGKNKTQVTFIDYTTYDLQERYNTTISLFYTGVPQYYEHLTPQQKDLLFKMGGALVAYFMGHIPNIHKVIHQDDFQVAREKLHALSQRYGGLSKLLEVTKGQDSVRDYWLFKYREEKLQKEVVNFHQHRASFKGLILISYGADHDFSDDFGGYSFETGSHCNSWKENL